MAGRQGEADVAPVWHLGFASSRRNFKDQDLRFRTVNVCLSNRVRRRSSNPLESWKCLQCANRNPHAQSDNPRGHFRQRDLNKHGKAEQTSQQQNESPSPIQTTPRKQVTPASMNNTPKAHHNHSASAPPIIPPMSPRKTQSGPNSHLSMALRLAARELEEERGLDAVPPGYRGIGDDIDVYPPEPVLAPKPSVPALTFYQGVYA